MAEATESKLANNNKRAIISDFMDVAKIFVVDTRLQLRYIAPSSM